MILNYYINGIMEKINDSKKVKELAIIIFERTIDWMNIIST